MCLSKLLAQIFVRPLNKSKTITIILRIVTQYFVLHPFLPFSIDSVEQSTGIGNIFFIQFNQSTQYFLFQFIDCTDVDYSALYMDLKTTETFPIEFNEAESDISTPVYLKNFMYVGYVLYQSFLDKRRNFTTPIFWELVSRVINFYFGTL